MLKEAGLTASRKLNIPKNNMIYVARNRGNNDIAPSEKLLREFKNRSAEYGGTAEAHNRAFKDIHYERKFRRQVLHNPQALKKLENLSRRSRKKDIYLICYEGNSKACHRRILLRLCRELFGAAIQIDGIEVKGI